MPRRASAALLAGLLAVAGAGGPGPVTALDTSANPRLLDTHFGRYGPRATRVAVKERGGVRLRLPADPKGGKPTGLYSYFALAGDFEVSASYEVLDLPAPSAGYGAGFGLTVQTKGPDGDLTVRRGNWPGEGHGLQVVRSTPDPAEQYGMRYVGKYFKTSAKKGRIVMRREKADLVVLTADAWNAEPTELHREPFTEATVRTLLVFADSGGSPTVVDGRLTNLTVKAAEITGGIPERDHDELPGWVVSVSVAAAVALGVGLWWWVRRRRVAGPPAR